MKKVFLALGTAIMLSGGLVAQNAPTTCGTDLFYKRALEANPSLIQNQVNFENTVAAYNANNPAGEKAVRIIPVVFHVIHEVFVTL